MGKGYNAPPLLHMRAALLVALFVALCAVAPRAQDVRPLAPGTTVARELSPGETHSYQLAAGRGDLIALTLQQQGIDVAVTLLDPQGREVLAVDAMDDEFRPETVIAVAETDGTYTLTTKPSPNPFAPGRYTIQVEPLRPATTGDAARIEAERTFARARKERNNSQPATWPAALADFTAARDRYRTAGDRAGEMKALIEIGVTENYMSRAEAMVTADEAERLARALDDRAALARVLRMKASIHLLAGTLVEAVRSVEDATAINQAIGNRVAESHSLNFTALVYARLGDVEKAIALYERALPLARATQNRQLVSAVLNNLGVVYANVGEYDKALAVYRQALSDARAANDRRGESSALTNLGGLHAKLGHHAQALELRLQALDQSRKAGDERNIASSLNNVGIAHFASGDYARALDYHREALALHRQLGDLPGQGWALGGAGRALQRLGRQDEALTTLHEALTIYRHTRERFGERETLAAIGRAHRARGELDEAVRYIRASVALDEAMRAEITTPELRTTFVAAEQHKYELLIDVLQQKHRVDPGGGHERAALEVSERARARALLDSLIDARVDLREGISSALLDRERAVYKQLNDAAADLSRLFGRKSREEALSDAARKVDALTVEYQEVQAQIRRESPHYASITQPQPLTAAEIQAEVVDANTVLLEIALGDERSWLWAVTPQEVVSVELPPRRTLEAAARALYERLTARQPRRSEPTVDYTARVAAADRGVREATAEVSRMLLGGIAAPLNGSWRGRRLAIVASGALEYLPFAALPVPGHAGVPLIARHEIVTVPSASVLALLRRDTADRPAAARTMAIVADPVFESADPRITKRPSVQRVSASRGTTSSVVSARDGFARLPFSRDEATAIATIAGDGRAFKAFDFAASRATMLDGGLRGYRYVHFATHGLVDSQRPSLSGLILSLFDERGTAQNGHVRLHDIYNTRLDADLVVLSACQTALGKEIKGEGLVSLTRAFMYAGAPRVVATLWQVNDHATAELMRHFYAGMLRQKLSPAAALRAAQRQLAKDPRWRAPYYWAGFVLQGDWRP